MATRRKTRRIQSKRAVDSPVELAKSPESLSSEFEQSIAEGSFSDRDVLEGILELLLSLTQKITGKTVAVSIQNRHGHRAAIGASKNKVYYL